MADLKISALNPAAALAGTEELPVVQGGTTVRASAAAVAALAGAITQAQGDARYLQLTERGTAGGLVDAGKVAQLDATGRITTAMLPAGVTGALHFMGTFTPAPGAEYPANATPGGLYIITGLVGPYTWVAGPLAGRSGVNGDMLIDTGAVPLWELVDQVSYALTATQADARYLQLTGGTLTGGLTLAPQTGPGSVVPTAGQAVSSAHVAATYLSLAGGTLAGALTLPAQTGAGSTAPTARQAVAKDYADATYVPVAGTTAAGGTAAQAAMVPVLDAQGELDFSFMPSAVKGAMQFRGAFTPAAGAEYPAGAGRGDVYVIAGLGAPYVWTTGTLSGDTADNNDLIIHGSGNTWSLVDQVGVGALTEAAADVRYLQLAGGTLTGPLTLPAQTGAGATAPTALQAVAKDYADATYAPVRETVRQSASATLSGTGILTVGPLGGSPTFVDGLVSGDALTLHISYAGFTITWPAGIKWVGGSAPPAAAAANVQIVELWKVGAVLYGALVGEVT